MNDSATVDNTICVAIVLLFKYYNLDGAFFVANPPLSKKGMYPFPRKYRERFENRNSFTKIFQPRSISQLQGCNISKMWGRQSSCGRCAFVTFVTMISVYWKIIEPVIPSHCEGDWRVVNSPRPNVASWWRHQMETFPVWLALCAGNSPVTGEFTPQRPMTRSFDVFFDLRLNKRLYTQPWGWWFETSSRSLWRHCNDKRRQ